MNIDLIKLKIKDLVEGYEDNLEEGVFAYSGKLDVRPPYQREFVYPDDKRNAVIDSVSKKYPLNVISPKSHAFLNSCYANMEGKQKTQGDQFVLMNKVNAKQRNVNDGDMVKVFNDRGSYEGVLRLTDDVNPGIIVSTLGYWRQHNKGTVNRISSAEFANMGNAPTFSDNLVEVTKV